MGNFHRGGDRNRSNGGGGFRKFGGDRGGFGGGGRGGFGGGRDFSNRDREMFDVVCSECGNDCKVPFKPSTDKPIYCDNCFASKKNDRPERSESRGDRFEKPAYVSRPRNEGGASNNEDMKKQFAELNAKIDRLVNLFEKSVETKTVKAETVSAPAEKVSEEKPKKAKATKKVSKKK